MSSEFLQLEATCRTCSAIANDRKYFTPIFGEASFQSSRSEIFAELISFNLGVEEEDGLPQQICPKCIKAFEMIITFRKRCKDVQDELWKYFKDIRTNVTGRTEIQQNANTEILEVEQTVFESNLSDEDDVSNWECEYYIESDGDVDISLGTAIYITRDGQEIEEGKDMFSEDVEYMQNTMNTPDKGLVKNKNDQQQVVNENDLSAEDDASNWKCEYYIQSDDDDDNISFATPIYITRDGQEIDEEKDMLFENVEYIDNTMDIPDISLVADENDQSQNIDVFCTPDREEGKNKKSNEENLNPNPADFNAGFKYACTFCGNRYRFIYALKTHLPVCPKLPAARCKICTVEFVSEELHDKHIEEYHPNGGPPMCPICLCTFTDPTKRNLHIHSAHRKQEETKCNICNRIFKTKNSMSTHKARYHGVGNYECSICHMKFTMTRKYTSHLMSHDENKNFKCQYCGKPFDSRHRVEIHERSHTGERPLLCNICGLRYRYRTEFQEHLKSHTNHTDYKCEYCGKCFMSRKQLRCHIQTHHTCNICGKKFLTSILKKIHKEQEHKNRNEIGACRRRNNKPMAHPFNCSVCSRGFNFASSFAAHIKMHTEDRPHACKECRSRFKRADHLQLHIRRVHLKIRSHICELCGNKFLDRWTLKTHMLVHSEETPFKCSKCSKEFKRSRSLQMHMLKHTGEKPFTCVICDRRFPCGKTLIQHTNTHSKDQIKLVEKEFDAKYKVKVNVHESITT